MFTTCTGEFTFPVPSMRFSSFGFRGKNSWCAVATVAVALLTGCSEDPGLQERLNRLQAEMQEKDRQLQDARSALEKTKSELKSARASSASKPAPAESPASAPDAKPQFLPREQVEQSYDAASKAMQKRLASELRNYSVENCTQFPVAMPSDEYPYHSKVALTFRSDNGRPYRLEFPVSADTSGKWTFPNSTDVAGALADSRQPDQNTNFTAGSATPAPAGSPRTAQNGGTLPTTSRTTTPSNPQLVPGQTATETRVIDWGGGRSTNNNRPMPSPATAGSVTPAPQPSPQSGKAPAQTMPSDKDVRIHW